MNKDIKKSIAGFFQEINEKTIPVIWTESDGPRPKGLYISLKITPVSGTENDEYKNLPDGSILQTTRLTYSLSIQAYRKGAVSVIHKLRQTLRKQSYADKFFIDLRGDNHILSIGLTSNMLDLTALVETNHEERASLDITLNYAESTIDDGFKDCGLGTTFPVIINGVIKDANGETIVNKTITISK